MSLGIYLNGRHCSHLCELALQAYEVYLGAICSKIGGNVQVNAVHTAEFGDPAEYASATVTLQIFLDAKAARHGNAKLPVCTASMSAHA